MRHRLVKLSAFTAVAVLGWLAFPGTAGAAGLGDPHGAGQKGDPHAQGLRGDPHDAPLVVETAAPATADGPTAGPAVQAAAKAVAENGSGGNGSADPPRTGKPANGTVGKADNKSPKGQSANDKNRGYECDDNNGIGKGNPAHSANCTTPQPPTPPTPPTVTPTVPVTPAQVLGVQFTRPSVAAGTLPRTGGSDQAAAVGTALALLLLGAALLAVAHRRAASA